ncbi:hypothetical protein GDO86_014414 [Hymenochirus boettgeri]|uniref:Uncharacterized protein n=1 Tax=Hymenochirus boettgeri TaxID=247094 RepID=A0A8T2JRQ3_9PIPI|nr:hypothetical protein GDO86_014414 [Hymenochirus boettgeri]
MMGPYTCFILSGFLGVGYIWVLGHGQWGKIVLQKTLTPHKTWSLPGLGGMRSDSPYIGINVMSQCHIGRTLGELISALPFI